MAFYGKEDASTIESPLSEFRDDINSISSDGEWSTTLQPEQEKASVLSVAPVTSPEDQDDDLDAFSSLVSKVVGDIRARLQCASTDSTCFSDNMSDKGSCSDASSIASLRPGLRGPSALTPSLKARCPGKRMQMIKSVACDGASGPRKSDHCDGQLAEFGKTENVNELRLEQWAEIGRRWEGSLCAEKKTEDRLRRPMNGTISPTETRGPMACCLPQKELEVVRDSCAELRYTKWVEVEPHWIATVCAEKKEEDARALGRSVESMGLFELESKCLLNRMEALDNRINQFPDESRASHDYYYKSKVPL